MPPRPAAGWSATSRRWCHTSGEMWSAAEELGVLPRQDASVGLEADQRWRLGVVLLRSRRHLGGRHPKGRVLLGLRGTDPFRQVGVVDESRPAGEVHGLEIDPPLTRFDQER